jgi:hypothetical protein
LPPIGIPVGDLVIARDVAVDKTYATITLGGADTTDTFGPSNSPDAFIPSATTIAYRPLVGRHDDHRRDRTGDRLMIEAFGSRIKVETPNRLPSGSGDRTG